MRQSRRLPWYVLLFSIFSPPGLLLAQSDSQTLRVVTYNIHHAQGKDGIVDYKRIAKIINDLNPDLVALQEVDKTTKRSNGVDQAKRLAKLTNLHYVFGPSMDFSSGKYGNAILSRFPVKDSKTVRLPTDPNLEPRSALFAKVQPGNGLPSLNFISTHFCHKNADIRLRQAKSLNDLINDSKNGEITLLAGDLNAHPESAPIQHLKMAGWSDAVAPKSKIDFIFYQSKHSWRVVECKIIDDLVASDHKPVLVVFSFPMKLKDARLDQHQ